jgi:hypothetical protein
VKTAVLGLDFGTSTTTAAVQIDGAPRLVRFDNETRTPSCVFWDESTGMLVAGRRARRQMQEAPDRYIRAPKRKVDESDVLVGDRLIGVGDVFTAVLAHALEAAKAMVGQTKVRELRLTHPAAWSAIRLATLRSAGHRALAAVEWSDVPIQLLAEPVAAAAEVAATGKIPTGKVLIVYDLGGGTFDVTAVRRTATGFEVVGMPDGHDACGGEDFDERLLKELDSRLSPRLPTWSQVYRPSAADTSALNLLRENVIAAKEALSKVVTFDVKVPPPAEHAEQVKRDEFVALIRDDIDETVKILAEAIDRARRNAGISESDIAGIVLAGGSSRIPLVAASIAQALPELELFSAEDSKGVVALGAARWEPQPVVPVASPNGAHAARDVPAVDLYSAGEFRCRLGIKVDGGWRVGETTVEVGNGDLLLRDYDCDLRSNEKWFDATRKKLGDGTVMGAATPAQVAGVETGVQAWTLESGSDGSAAKSLHRFALRRTGAGERGLLIVGREEAAELVSHVRIGASQLASREFAYTPFVVRVPPGKPVRERVTVRPKRRLLGRADFGVFAESSLVGRAATEDEWARRVLARFADTAVSIETTQDTFLGGRVAKRHVVRAQAGVFLDGYAWWCLWTGVVGDRGVAIGVEAAKELRGARVTQFRDAFVLADV